MAQPAGDLARPGTADLLKLLAPYPGRAEMATRIALICALTVFVTSAYGTPEAAISAYVVFFLNQPDRVLSVMTGVAMLVLVTVVVGLVMLVAMFALDDPLWRITCIAGLSLALLFVTSASKLRPVGAIIAMIVGFSLDELGSVPFGEAATRALLYAWVMVAIPIGISVCVNLLMAPSPRKLAGRELAKRLRLAARSLATEPEATGDALRACLRKGDAQIGTWLKLSVVDGSSARTDVAPLLQGVSSTLAILVAADLAAREPSGRLPASFVAPIAETLENMARTLAAGGYPVDIELSLPNVTELTPLARVVVEDLHAAITRFAVVDVDGSNQFAEVDKARPHRLKPEPHSSSSRSHHRAAAHRQERWILPPGCFHQSRPRPLCAENHRRGDVLLSALFANQLARVSTPASSRSTWCHSAPPPRLSRR